MLPCSISARACWMPLLTILPSAVCGCVEAPAACAAGGVVDAGGEAGLQPPSSGNVTMAAVSNTNGMREVMAVLALAMLVWVRGLVMMDSTFVTIAAHADRTEDHRGTG